MDWQQTSFLLSCKIRDRVSSAAVVQSLDREMVGR